MRTLSTRLSRLSFACTRRADLFRGLAFLVLHPLIFDNGVKVAGYDFFNYNWNFWWIRHALTTPGLNVYENNFAMFPYTTNYGYHALTASGFRSGRCSSRWSAR